MRIRAAAFAILIASSPAFAGSYLNAQFGNPVGFSQGSGRAQCTNPGALGYVQCVQVVNMTGLDGTFTVKRPNIEVLLVLYCMGSDNVKNTIWAGERFIGTSDISVQFLPPITGQCWFNWQEINSNSAVANDDFEYQVVLH
jgi:hypothetical protein